MTEKNIKGMRASYIGMPQHSDLSLACQTIQLAFGDCYLVGSCLERSDFRDVDVRVIMEDDEFMTMFGTRHPALSPLWNLMCVSISHYLAKQTGLNIDFQIQMRERIKEEDWNKRREPLGIFCVQVSDEEVQRVESRETFKKYKRQKGVE